MGESQLKNKKITTALSVKTNNSSLDRNVFTVVTPGNPLRYNTARAPGALPVSESALAHSRGFSKRSQLLVDMHEHSDTYGQAHVWSKGRSYPK